ncbi:hypothetical protein F2P81_003086 [Scophthalmus maximus]|uniref:Calx-beta domain-containing protein n=1 Tax=Scophthalmus maximus TaxID=52904 RepID=A0A6A4THI0_SCOMX|nr:hypothetical protein F2P81_003086 [Scophthalmus maximus]
MFNLKLLQKNKTIKYGVPMLLLVVGGSFGLREFTQIRYDSQKIKRKLDPSLEARVNLEKQPVMLEEEYQSISLKHRLHRHNRGCVTYVPYIIPMSLLPVSGSSPVAFSHTTCGRSSTPTTKGVIIHCDGNAIIIMDREKTIENTHRGNILVMEWPQQLLYAPRGKRAKARTTPSPLLSPSNATCEGNSKCRGGIILPIWYPEDPSMGDKIARVIVYFVAMIYMFLGVSIIADRFMAAIEVITSQEKEIVIKRPNGETTTTKIRVWNETVSNLTLMALGSSAPEIMLSVIEVCGHGFQAGELGPATIVGSAAFNMFVIIGLCVSVIPQGEVRKVKHLRVFFVTAGWSIFAYIWLYMILAVFSPNVVQVWEGLLTLAFFPICVILAWVADRRLLFYRFMHKRYRTDKHRGVIIETEAERSKGIEMDGKLVNSHFMDGGAASNLIGLIESKEVDESRRDMIRILKDLKQKHPEKEMDQLVEMANYYALSHQQKSRAFYRIQATRMMTGAGNILKKHVAEQAKKSVSVQEVHVEEPDEYVSRIAFEPAVYQCLENCGAAILTITRKGGDIDKTIYVDYKTEDGSANAGADYEFTEGTMVFKPGEMFKEISIGIIDDDIFEEDEHFFVRLNNLRVLETEDELLSPNSLPYPKAMLGFPSVATVTILDDDHSGIFTFESSSVHVSESIGIMELKVLRTSGARGTVIVPYRTIEGLAKGGGEDFEDNYGELEFKNDETCKLIHVKIIDDEEYEKNKNFFLELAEPRMVDMSLQKGDDGRERFTSWCGIRHSAVCVRALQLIASTSLGPAAPPERCRLPVFSAGLTAESGETSAERSMGNSCRSPQRR